MQVQETAELPDPCPLPSTIKRRSLNDKDRLIYAPMADVGGLLFDKDAVYINIPDWKVGARVPKLFRALRKRLSLLTSRATVAQLQTSCTTLINLTSNLLKSLFCDLPTHTNII